MEAIRKSIFVSFITKSFFPLFSIKTHKKKLGNIKDDYKFLKELGSGSYGVVFLVQNKISCKKYFLNKFYRF